MKVLVTGAAGHLGRALMDVLPPLGFDAIGLDRNKADSVHLVGDLGNSEWISEVVRGFDGILHTATLHKPHVATHTRQDFVDVNVSGTLNLLEAHKLNCRGPFVMASTTSVYARNLDPSEGNAAIWVDETLPPRPKNIYGITKVCAEDLCRLAARKDNLRATILRFARFFPEADDSAEIRENFADENAKANEFLFRRVDIEDAANAMAAALTRQNGAQVETLNIAATTPFTKADLDQINRDAAMVVRSRFPKFDSVYGRRGFTMFDRIGRVYDNAKARVLLDWSPVHDFESVLMQLHRHEPIGSKLSRNVGILGYHSQSYSDGPYPVDE